MPCTERPKTGTGRTSPYEPGVWDCDASSGPGADQRFPREHRLDTNLAIREPRFPSPAYEVEHPPVTKRARALGS